MKNMNVHICVPLPQSWTCLKCGEEIKEVENNRCPECRDSIAAQGANDEAWQEYAAKLPEIEDSWFGFEVNCSHGNCAEVEVKNVEEFCKLVPEARPLWWRGRCKAASYTTIMMIHHTPTKCD